MLLPKKGRSGDGRDGAGLLYWRAAHVRQNRRRG